MVQQIMDLTVSLPSSVSFSFNAIEGFGFIQPDDGCASVVVHRSAIQVKGVCTLAEGGKVEFQTDVDKEGNLQAVNVTGQDGNKVLTAAYRRPSVATVKNVVVVFQPSERLTTVAFVENVDVPRICQAFQKNFNCDVNMKVQPKFGQVIQLSGDKRAEAKDFLVLQEVCHSKNIVIFETSTRRGVVKRCVSLSEYL
jgi:cold shock CspA family protein/translation initiation factor 1 (eIF-1/SUI1)